MRLVFSVSFVLLTLISFGKKDPIKFAFEHKVDTLISLSDSIQQGKDLARILANQKFDRILREVLNDESSIHYDFSKVKCLSALGDRKSKKFKIYTWVLKLGNDTYDYFGYTQYQRKKGNSTLNYVYQLTNQSAQIGKNETDKLDSAHWIGCVYYELVRPKKRKDKTYLLIGWDGNNWRSTKKIIETFSFNNKGEITFGKPVIKYNIGTIKKPKLVTKSRLIFEYNGQVSVTISYNSNLKKVVFDHLAPPNPRMASMPWTHAPDFTYDALTYSKKKWIHSSDVDVRNQEETEAVKWKPADIKDRTAETLIPQRKN